VPGSTGQAGRAGQAECAELTYFSMSLTPVRCQRTYGAGRARRGHRVKYLFIFRWEGGKYLCALREIEFFASSVVSVHGIRDVRAQPPFDDLFDMVIVIKNRQVNWTLGSSLRL